jgi:hypothetical protein
MQLLNTQYPQVLCYPVPHRLNHPPHHFLFEHRQYIFFPYCERPSFTPIK